MTICEWPKNVNTKFYAQKNKIKDNVIKTENLSGRTVQFLANDKVIKTKELKLDLKNTSKNQEYKNFWTWYCDTLKIVNAFHCSSLDENSNKTYWQFVQTPEEETGQNIKTLTINIEQVYL